MDTTLDREESDSDSWRCESCDKLNYSVEFCESCGDYRYFNINEDDYDKDVDESVDDPD